MTLSNTPAQIVPPDFQQLYLEMLKGGLDKRSRDQVGLAVAKYINRTVGPDVLKGESTPELAEADRLLVKELSRSGDVYLPNVFSADDIQAIENYFEDQPGHASLGSDQDFLRRNVPPGVGFLHYATRLVCRCPQIYRVVHDPRLLRMAARYLGAPPTIGIIAAWWTFPVPGEPEVVESGMQMYHHDRGDFRSCNLFVYLSDVSEETGPHAFVERTHDFEALFRSASARFGSDRAQFDSFWAWMEQHRKTDEEIYSHFPRDDVKIHVGPKGTSFLEDTRGLHKGTRPRSGPRFAFEIFYSVMPQSNNATKPLNRAELAMPGGLATNNENIDPLVRYATRQFYV